ncbi:alpha/beta fold hydrolase [Avrilella dinanensis]|uniref:alpha/beta fold hydrolase n=1 Tax=Avrilella dinanensis TaxID=2008672 RepID=UPI001FAF524E|nr:alpha/beta fold hydrolase [Avrilella dinanensis]
MLQNQLNKILFQDYPFPTGKITDITLTYQLFGQPLHTSPVVLVNHALTGNSEVAGKNGWWTQLVGYNQVIDLNRYTILTFDIPGNGFGGESENLFENYTDFSTKIIADLFWKGLDELNINQLFAVVGGSLGGGIAWEMLFQHSQRIQHLIPIATSIQSSDWLKANVLVQEQILNNSLQPIENARMHAMLLYRTPISLTWKFNRQVKADEQQYAVESWLKYHGRALQSRFELPAYQLMNHLLRTIGEDLCPEDIIQLAKITSAQIHLVAIDSDLMFTHEEQKNTYETFKRYTEKVNFSTIKSIHGHDAFLIEYEQLNTILNNIFKQ